jgi:hypothetical protein
LVLLLGTDTSFAIFYILKTLLGKQSIGTWNLTYPPSIFKKLTGIGNIFHFDPDQKEFIPVKI